MSIDQITAEQEATESLIKFLEQAKRCQMLYDRARMSLPEPLKRVLGMNGAAAVAQSAMTIPAPQPPPMPNGAKSDWVWISQESATPTNILLALLRASKAPIRAREVIAQVHEIQPAVLRGSINNIGSRLGGKTIGRTKDGWRLINPDAAGIIHAGYLWGPREILFKTELAAHRREAILHVLGFFQSGLQLRQILEQLKRCPWVRAPLSKDLLKADLELLNEAKKIRKRGKSGKWEIVSTDEDPTTGNTP